VLAALALLIFSSAFAAAQTAARGVAVAGTSKMRPARFFPRVTLLRDETSPSLQETVTDAAGAFRFERVPPGAYVIRTEFRAFKPGSARVRVSSSAPSKRPSR
jgi:hypothetical protein